MTMQGILDLAVVGGYRCIVIDPPWHYSRQRKWDSPSNRVRRTAYAMPYKTMTVDEIKAVPVPHLAAGSCEIYLWTTQRHLREAFDVLCHWGAKYCQLLTWCKTPRGLGQGGMYCPTTEFLMLGRMGTAPAGKRRIDSTWWLVKRQHNSHSQKPEYFQTMIESVTDEPRLELFARRRRFGWAVWGDQIENEEQLQLTAQQHGEQR